jgi:hypothetical protein
VGGPLVIFLFCGYMAVVTPHTSMVTLWGWGTTYPGDEKSAGETNLRTSQHRESHDERSEMTSYSRFSDERCSGWKAAVSTSSVGMM